MGIFKSKRKKIEGYLSAKNDLSAFDRLLSDYLSGALADRLSGAGLSDLEVCVDLLDDCKCIGIQGNFGEYCVDLQIMDDHFSIAFDLDEPDDHTEFSLSEPEDFYRKVAEILRDITK